jgi:uncharacterized alkaline shock family protein YloU
MSESTTSSVIRPGYVIAEGVLEEIARRAAEEVDGVEVAQRRARRGREVSVEVRGDRLAASMAVTVRHGVVLPVAAEEARTQAGRMLARMSGLAVATVDVVVAGVS